MALAEQVQKLLNAFRDAGFKPIETMTVPEARLASWRIIGLQGEPEPVAAVAHRFIPGPTADLPVRIYYPTGSGPFPALVYFHGGGFVILNIEILDPTCRVMANRTGCAIVSVNYQKAPERKYPTAVDDAYAATKWIAEHAKEINIDPVRIGVLGESAGGALAAVTGLRARDEGGPSLFGQVLITPITDADVNKPSYLANAEGYLHQRATMQWYFDHYLNSAADGADWRVSPLRAPDHARLPPALVITAEYDPLRDDGHLYAEKLKAAGVPTLHSDYAGMVHPFFFMQGVLDASRRLHDEIGAWVRNVLAQPG